MSDYVRTPPTYIRIGTPPTCWCGKPSYWLLRTFGSQLEHMCKEHGDAVRKGRGQWLNSLTS